jgi:hypothetical protein
VNASSIPGWGPELKHQIRKQYGGTISLRGYGERLPDYNNYFRVPGA